jgi:SAM-dependent methyltransferase
MGAVYLFHNIYGFLMEMSPDIVDLINAFEGGEDVAAVSQRYAGRFGDNDPAQFIDVLAAHFVLIDLERDAAGTLEDEVDGIWPMCVFKGKWNVWRRRENSLTLWTAWGERPVQQILLDADETKMWDAFDGEKRLAELRGKFDPIKLRALVLRLSHSDVQAIKLSMMPSSTYAKRPGLTPKYLVSTMPYPSWTPGTAVPGARDGDVSPTDYYRNDIHHAPSQFDHQETTLSHLLRIPHPALAHRSYGQALIDTLIDRGLVGKIANVPAGHIRIAEVGAGLGYLARDVIARLQSRGVSVDYTIVELSKTLADAQAKTLAGATNVRWIIGDVLATELPAASFDLIISNEMIGDLPAEQHTRADIGLAEENTGPADKERLRMFGKGAELAADWDVNLDDAPEPFYLLTGCFVLVDKIARWLAPGGSAVVTEFGEYSQWPKLSTHLDHPELSIHFGHLAQAANACGLQSKLEFVIDLLEFDRNQQGLATTRSHFRALAAMIESAGGALPKIGYTRALLSETLGPDLALDHIGEIRFDRIEDRLMGLVPHEFKALLATKPA